MCKTRVCNEKRTLVGERILFYYSEKKTKKKNSCGALQHCTGVAGGGVDYTYRKEIWQCTKP